MERVGQLREALLPDPHERLPIVLITAMQRVKVDFVSSLVCRHQIHGWEFETAQEFANKQPSHATVEVGEWVDGKQLKQLTFSECKCFQEERLKATGSVFYSHAQVFRIFTDQDRHAIWRGWVVLPRCSPSLTSASRQRPAHSGTNPAAISL